MTPANKIIGVGMSKTGTKTLGACLDLLGFTPRCSFREDLKQLVWSGRSLNPISNFPYSYDPDDLGLRDDVEEEIRKVAAPFRSFEDSPWYLLFRQLDQAFPGSKFILTLRKDSRTRAESNWRHCARLGRCAGAPDPAFVASDIQAYERHNDAVRRYFAARPEQLLVVCWESGDGWARLCEFLGVSVPDAPFPHEHRGPDTSAPGTLRRYLSEIRRRMI